MPARMKYLKLQ